ncbi:hypothetical protein [Janthinobacterium sp. 1_2014MBL_MicDiv]|uniref:hypothetical protein n=1 Tax=Janthinobacterium sp. 1_2014MBL_MicDiv TaxID=1644131 RepID=UPI0012EB3021|nr:hypothetical protein [Janthinobacterium sp. 1_2014MBL_MicDiv]
MLRHSPPDAPRTRLPHWLSLKGAAVALILAMHALGLYFLLLPARQLKQYTEVAFLTLMPPRPLPRPLPRTPPMPLPMPMPRARAIAPVAPPALPPVLAESVAAPAETITAPVDAPPAAPTEDLRTRARLAAGAADKALRAELQKDKPWLAAPEIDSQTTFQKLVASARRGGAVLAVDDYLTADGRPASRVRTPGGSTCFAMGDNPGAGADPFKTGGKLKRVACPG